MTTLESLLAEHETILADGAMGTMLMKAGLGYGASPESWNLEHPDRIQAVHRAYIQAGAQIVLTNTFGGSTFRMQRHGLGERVFEVNRIGAELARAEADAAPHPVVVAGSMGPTGGMFTPLGTLTAEAAREAYAEQAAGLAAGGADVLWIETMSDLQEVQAAIEGARSTSTLPLVVTMTFDTHGRTMMGIPPLKALEALKVYGLVALGGNCGNGPTEIEAVIEAMHGADSTAVLVAKSNAGMPKVVGSDVVYDGTPEVMAAHVERVRALGARIIGGCCGTTPDHIRAMARALQVG